MAGGVAADDLVSLLVAVLSLEILFEGWQERGFGHPRQAFDRKDVSAIVTDRKRKARIDPSSVDDDRAGAALAAVTALLGSCQMEAFAKKIQERYTRVIELDRSRDAVHGESGWEAHVVSLEGW